jgi:hypothetical protein
MRTPKIVSKDETKVGVEHFQSKSNLDPMSPGEKQKLKEEMKA